jgi:hypothetical protein
MLNLCVSIYDDLNLAMPCVFCFETEPKPLHQENKEIAMDFFAVVEQQVVAEELGSPPNNNN